MMTANLTLLYELGKARMADLRRDDVRRVREADR